MWFLRVCHQVPHEPYVNWFYPFIFLLLLVSSFGSLFSPFFHIYSHYLLLLISPFWHPFLPSFSHSNFWHYSFFPLFPIILPSNFIHPRLSLFVSFHSSLHSISHQAKEEEKSFSWSKCYFPRAKLPIKTQCEYSSLLPCHAISSAK